MTALKKMLLGLADELLLHVTDHLPAIQQLLNLRLVCRRLSDIALGAQVKRMRTIYVDLSKSSLERFSKICGSRFHAASIREVIYIPALHKLSSLQLESNSNLSAIVAHHKCSRQLIAETLELYARVNSAQRRLIASGEVERTLASCLPLLPKLRKVLIRALPASNNARGPPEAEKEIYNKHRSWRYHGDGSTAAEARRPMLEQFARDELCFTMQYKTDVKSFENPIRMLHALGSLHNQACKEGIELCYQMYPPKALTLEKDASFAAQIALPSFRRAVQNITRLRLILADAPPASLFHVQTPAARIALWVEILGTMCNVKQLKMWEFGCDLVAFIKATLQHVTFPKLEALEIETLTLFWDTSLLVRYDQYRHYFSTQTLAAFICKHARTLKHLS